MPATTIDQVIARLEAIVEETKASQNPLGIFALVYLDVTRTVKAGIAEGKFQDGPRMERLDVIFANRYIAAYEAYRIGQPCTHSWKTAFDAAKKFDLLILQHLLMGMNAHNNLDLGIAAAESISAEGLPSSEADFFAVNLLLAAKIDHLQDKLSAVSPLLFLLDWFGQRSDERFAAFSLKKARGHAWQVANRLSKLAPAAKALEINELDGYVSVLNKLITHPGVMFAGLLRFIRFFEKKDVGLVLDTLA
ncbi:MAG: hypothetical protein HY842_18735 [Bacteroidetes bacterium]|nr:hypothetical protein [Bacteroidota bacterium]